MANQHWTNDLVNPTRIPEYHEGSTPAKELFASARETLVVLDWLYHRHLWKWTTLPEGAREKEDRSREALGLHRVTIERLVDFLLATSHPSASAALHLLAEQLDVPERLCAMLDRFLRSLCARDAPQEPLLTFVVHATEIMEDLLVRLPSLQAHWSTCILNLARYGAARHDAREYWIAKGDMSYKRALRCGAANSGQLHYYMALLRGKEDLRQLCFLAKSQICERPARSAEREHWDWGVGAEEQLRRAENRGTGTIHEHAEAVYSIACSFFTVEDFDEKYPKFRQLLRQPGVLTAELGVDLVVLNISAILGFGAPKDHLIRLYRIPLDQLGPPYIVTYPPPDSARFIQSRHLCSSLSNLILACGCAECPDSLPSTLPAIHVLLVWLHSIHKLQHRYSLPALPLDTSALDWPALAAVLNTLVVQQPITEQLRGYASSNRLPSPGPGIKGCSRPLEEDFLLKGFIWAQSCFDAAFLVPRNMEDYPEGTSIHESRVERVLLRGLSLALMGGELWYDEQTKMFSTASQPASAPVVPERSPECEAGGVAPGRASSVRRQKSTRQQRSSLRLATQRSIEHGTVSQPRRHSTESSLRRSVRLKRN